MLPRQRTFASSSSRPGLGLLGYLRQRSNCLGAGYGRGALIVSDIRVP